MIEKVLIGVLALSVVALGAVSVLNPAVNSEKISERVVERLGAMPGTDFLEGAYITAFKSQDGVIRNETNATLTALQLCRDNYVELGYATSVQTVTLPSAPDLVAGGCFPGVESVSKPIYLRNASSGPSALNIVAGASSTIYVLNLATSTPTVVAESGGTSTIVAGAAARLSGVRITSSTPWIIWFLEPFKNVLE